MNKHRLWIGLSLVWVLTGCIYNQPTESDLLPAQNLTEARPSLERIRENPYAKRVVIPKTAPWLAQALKIRYQDISAFLVIKQIADRYPVKFLFAPDLDLEVRDAAGAISIKEHLDNICSQANWAYTVTDSGVVLVNDIETKTFNLAVQPGHSETKVYLRNLGSSVQGSAAENDLTVELDPYENEVVALLESILGLKSENTPLLEAGEASTDPTRQPPASEVTTLDLDPRTSVVLLPSANSVVVTAPPHLMRQVENTLADYTSATAKSVVLNIAFFEVDLSESKERNLNLNLLGGTARKFGISLIPQSTLIRPSNLSFNLNSGNLRGSSAVLNWLNTVASTSLTFEDTVEVRNNSVGSLDVTSTRQYVKSVSRESQSSGSTTASSPTVEFDVLRTGWSIHLQPTIVGDLIVIRIGLSRSDFVREIPYNFDSGRIAGTNFVTADYNRLMAIRLRNGETKLLASLSSQEERQQDGRVPWLPLIGDRHTKASRKTETVMMLSAEIL